MTWPPRHPARVQRPAPHRTARARALVHRRVQARADHRRRFVCQMDADLSHDPKYLPAMVAAATRADLVLGSRYLNGVSVVNWPLRRLILSSFANPYVRTITGVGARDSTSGFRCWTAETLSRLSLDRFLSDGYSFRSRRCSRRRASAAGSSRCRSSSSSAARAARRLSGGSFSSRCSCRGGWSSATGAGSAAGPRMLRPETGQDLPVTGGAEREVRTLARRRKAVVRLGLSTCLIRHTNRA